MSTKPGGRTVKALVSARGAAGLTQEEAAKRAGTTGQTVYEWERGKRLDAWEKRLEYLRLLAGESRTARNIILELLDLPTPEEAELDPQVAEIVKLLERARREPGWDHAYYVLKRLLEPRNDRGSEPATRAETPA